MPDWTPDAFNAVVDILHWKELCVNEWDLSSVSYPKLAHGFFHFAPPEGTIAPGIGFYRPSLTQVSDGKGSFTGWRHMIAAVRNAEIALGIQEHVLTEPAKLGAARLFGYENIPNRPAAFLYNQGDSNCAPDGRVPGFASGSIRIIPSKIAAVTFDSRTDPKIFELIDERLKSLDPDGYGANVSRYWDPYNVFRRFEVKQISFGIKEFSQTGSLERVIYKRKPRKWGRALTPRWQTEHEQLTLARKFIHQQKKLAKNPNRKGFGRKGTGVDQLADSTKRIVAAPVIKKLERLEERRIALELKLATMKAETGFDKEKLRRAIRKCREQSKATSKRLRWTIKRKEGKARAEKIKLMQRLSRASARCNVPRSRRRKPKTRNWRRSTALRRRRRRGKR